MKHKVQRQLTAVRVFAWGAAVACGLYWRSAALQKRRVGYVDKLVAMRFALGGITTVVVILLVKAFLALVT